MQAEIIYEDDDCVITHQPGGSSFSLVSFASLDHRPNGLWFWGREATTKLDIDSIGIVTKSDHRYPREMLLRAAPSIRARTKSISIGYGHSMGAYGTLRNGRALGLTHCLALSPVNYTLTENLVDKTIWSRDYCPERSPGPFISVLDLAPINLQIVDPYFPYDFEQARLFAAAGRIETVKLPFVAHDTIGVMRSSSRLLQVIALLLTEDFDAIGRLLNLARRQMPDRPANLARACLARGQRSRAENLLRRAKNDNIADQVLQKARMAGIIENAQRKFSRNSYLSEAEGLAYVTRCVVEFGQEFRFQNAFADVCERYGHLAASALPARLALQCAASSRERASAALRLSHILDRQGRGDEALGYARLARDEHPARVEIQRHVARLANDLGGHAEAEAAYRAALNHASAGQERAQAAFDLSHWLDRQGRADEAWEYARLAQIEHPERVEIQRHAARLANDLGGHAEAEGAYRAALNHASAGHERAQVAFDLSHWLDRQGRADEALEYARLARDEHPENVGIQRHVARLANDLGGHAEAEAAYRAALNHASAGQERAQAAFDLSHWLDRQGRADEAWEYARLAQIEHPERVEIQRHAARLANDLGGHAEAEGAYRAALNHASAGHERAQVAFDLSHWLDEQGRADEALEYARLARDEHPENVGIQRHVARLANDLGGHAEAEAAYRAALNHASAGQERSEMGLSLSHYLASRKRPREALEYAEAALLTAPENIDIWVQIGHLRLMQGDRPGALRVIEKLRHAALADHPHLNLLTKRSRIIPYLIRRAMHGLGKLRPAEGQNKNKLS